MGPRHVRVVAGPKGGAVIPGYRLDFGFHTLFVALLGQHDQAMLMNLAGELNIISQGRRWA